jgi:pSer/pThr/pTyr-binding forkhead associated (FHA) protein
LEALDGPQPGRTYIVPPETTSVGRSPENDVVLNSPDVSRRHARLECTHGGVRVTDLNSTNGTRVDGRPVRVIDVDQDTEISFGGVRMWMSIHREGDRRQ